MTREALLEEARRKMKRYRIDDPQFVAWVRVEAMLMVESAVPTVARRFLHEIEQTLGAATATHVRRLAAHLLEPAPPQATTQPSPARPSDQRKEIVTEPVSHPAEG